MGDTDMFVVAELQNGTTLYGGKYVIEKKIGEGGFGITYKAMQSGLGRAVCIKEYFPTGKCVRDPQARTIHLQGMSEEMFEKYRLAFVREAQTLAQLHHQGIVEVIDVFDENNTSYMVMPFIEGRSLQSIVEQNGPLSYPEAVNYIAQVCNAIDYIHQRNILHRDIKPDNIMITADYKAVLIDFGSAREFEQDKTQAHTSILTQGYAPIEQYSRTSRKGSYTDIYALGATFYFILTGQVPTEAATRMIEPLPEPSQLNPSIPEEGNRTIMKAMELKGENRHQTVQEFMDDLRNVKSSATAPDPIVEQKQKPEIEKKPDKAVATSKKTEQVYTLDSLPPHDQNDGKKTNKGKIAFIVAGVIVVLCSLVLFFVLKDNPEKKMKSILAEVDDYFTQAEQQLEPINNIQDFLAFCNDFNSNRVAFIENKFPTDEKGNYKGLSEDQTREVNYSIYARATEYNKKESAKCGEFLAPLINKLNIASKNAKKEYESNGDVSKATQAIVIVAQEDISVFNDYDNVPVEIQESYAQITKILENLPPFNGNEYIDLGLPSGTLWKYKNEEEGFYTYDEAVQKFGNRLPNKEQFGELYNMCQWEWTGSGYKVIGPNGNYIVLPTTGYRECDGRVNSDYVGSYGNYWSSTATDSDHAQGLHFSSDTMYMFNDIRCGGRFVRLVQD